MLLPGGVEQYLEIATRPARRTAPTGRRLSAGPTGAAESRQARKDLARIESQLAKVGRRIDRLHEQMADAASDYARLAELQAELATATARQRARRSWLDTAEHLDRRENAALTVSAPVVDDTRVDTLIAHGAGARSPTLERSMDRS